MDANLDGLYLRTRALFDLLGLYVPFAVPNELDFQDTVNYTFMMVEMMSKLALEDMDEGIPLGDDELINWLGTRVAHLERMRTYLPILKQQRDESQRAQMHAQNVNQAEVNTRSQ